ncbi:hypothetical protein T02_9828 [Trichinella nativa]|uniref:Uncharacterized protein n=1 Tax=Trichinella nativa TaxID=6335 RepID=A0A0V1LBK9_9BILA|nr:hypothetical protein T02_9828 [Trichinella nativa]
MYAQAFWVARSFLLVSEAFTDFSGIFSNVASVIMDINTGALMFLNVYISRSRYNERYLSDNCCWEQHFYSMLCIPPTAVQVHQVAAVT